MSLSTFTAIAGVRVHYDRLTDSRYMYGTQGLPYELRADAAFLDRLTACLVELWEVCPYGRAATISSAGAYVAKPGFHGKGRAFDLDAIFWPGKRVWRSLDYAVQPMLYLGIEAVLRRHFGTVLGFSYDAAHRDHLHVDDGREPGFDAEARSCGEFLRVVATQLGGRQLEPEGQPISEIGRAALEVLDLRGDLHNREIWLELLMRTARAAFDADEGTDAADPGRGLRMPPRRGLSRLKQHDPETTSFLERWRAERRAAGHSTSVELTWVRHAAIAPSVKLAVLYSEDARFLRHRGIDWVEIRHALREAMRGHRPVRGASTVTQQLVKNLWLTPARGLSRKAKEAVLALWLELTVPKKRILELYLNVVRYGPGVFGVEAAAARYFNKTAAELSPREAAELAAALARPSSWYPGCGDPAYGRRVAWIERTVLAGGPEALADESFLHRGVRAVLHRLRL